MKKKNAKTLLLLLLTGALCFAASCGGGGGGGGGAVVTPPSPTYVSLSSISPASGSVIDANSATLTFTSSKAATCRYSFQDQGYSSMSSACSGGGTTSHTCSVSGLSEGSDYIYVACSPAEGDDDTALTNEHIAYTIDTADPSISIDYPADGSSFGVTGLPSRAEISYSDASSGPDPSSIQVTFSVNQRTLSMTDLFGKDAAANASGSRTDASNTDPFQKTSVIRSGSFPSPSPAETWTVERTGALKVRLVPVDTTRCFAWDPSGTKGTLVNVQSDAETVFTFPSPPLSVAASAVSGKLYAVFSGEDKLYIYSLSNPSSVTTQNLSGSPSLLSHCAGSNKLQIAYSDLTRVDTWDCAGGNIEGSINTGHSPYLLSAVQGNADEVVTVATGAGGVRLYKTDSSGAQSDVLLGMQYPKRLILNAADTYAYASLYSDDKVAVVNLSSITKTEVQVGSAPNAIFFNAAGNIFCINSGAATVSTISTSSFSVTSTDPVSVAVSDGLYLTGVGGDYVIAEDIWNISSDASVTLTASIEDMADHAVSDSVDFTATVSVIP